MRICFPWNYSDFAKSRRIAKGVSRKAYMHIKHLILGNWGYLENVNIKMLNIEHICNVSDITK